MQQNVLTHRDQHAGRFQSDAISRTGDQYAFLHGIVFLTQVSMAVYWRPDVSALSRYPPGLLRWLSAASFTSGHGIFWRHFASPWRRTIGTVGFGRHGPEFQILLPRETSMRVSAKFTPKVETYCRRHDNEDIRTARRNLVPRSRTSWPIGSVK